jgi:hypothetical protein
MQKIGTGEKLQSGRQFMQPNWQFGKGAKLNNTQFIKQANMNGRHAYRNAAKRADRKGTARSH